MELSHRLAEVLRAARSARGWSIRDMAEKAAVAPMTVQRVEKGLPIRPESWRGVARAFALEEEILVGATTREDGPARVAQALGLEGAAIAPARPSVGYGVGEDGRVTVALTSPYPGTPAQSVDPTPDEEALVRALDIVTRIEDKRMAGAAIGPLISLLTSSLIERTEYMNRRETS